MILRSRALKSILRRRIGSILRKTTQQDWLNVTVLCNAGAEINSWESPIGGPGWTPERELKGLFFFLTRYGCAKPGELQTQRFRPGWNETNQKSRERMCKPVAHRGSLTFESWLCKHMRGKRELHLLCSQKSLGTSRIDQRMCTAGLFWRAENTAHCTKVRVTSANDYAPVDFSNKYSQIKLRFEEAKWRIQSQLMGQSQASNASDLYIVFKTFCLNIFWHKKWGYLFPLNIPISNFSWKLGRTDNTGPTFPCSIHRFTGLFSLIYNSYLVPLMFRVCHRCSLPA